MALNKLNLAFFNQGGQFKAAMTETAKPEEIHQELGLEAGKDHILWVVAAELNKEKLTEALDVLERLDSLYDEGWITNLIDHLNAISFKAGAKCAEARLRTRSDAGM